MGADGELEDIVRSEKFPVHSGLFQPFGRTICSAREIHHRNRPFIVWSRDPNLPRAYIVHEITCRILASSVAVTSESFSSAAMTNAPWPHLTRMVEHYLLHMHDVQFCIEMIQLAVSVTDMRLQVCAMIEAIGSDNFRSEDMHQDWKIRFDSKWRAIDSQVPALFRSLRDPAQMEKHQLDVLTFRHLYDSMEYAHDRVGCYGFEQFGVRVHIL